MVKHVIEKNKRLYSNSSISFLHENILTFDLPKADLLLCKHVLQYLSNADVALFTQQLKKFKYCLITNQVESRSRSGDNEDIECGGGRKLDLRRAPFNIMACVVLEYNLGNGGLHQVLLIDNASK